MPLAEAEFVDGDKRPDPNQLIFHGPTLVVIVGALAVDHTDTETCHALVDTGASESCIDEQLAIRLKLPVIDVAQISGIGGAVEHDVYSAYINIPTLDTMQHGRFTGVKMSEGGQAHSVLLGRTFLSMTIMIYDGIRGIVTLASAKMQETTPSIIVDQDTSPEPKPPE